MIDYRQALPAEFITDLAMGAKDPVLIAARYGYTPEDYLELEAQPWFPRQVADRRKTLEAEGLTFKAKMGAMAEDLLIDAYNAAKNGDSAQVKLSVATYLTKIAELEPKPQVAALNTGAAVGGFTIHISVPAMLDGAGLPVAAQTLDLTAIEEIALDPAPPYVEPPHANYELVAGVEV